MKPPYRVQEYVMDMGGYHKSCIIDGVSNSDYNKQNVCLMSFYVILPSDDCFGDKLPQTIRTEQERVKICREGEAKSWTS